MLNLATFSGIVSVSPGVSEVERKGKMVDTEREELRKVTELAMQVQDACNIGGMVCHFPRVLAAVSAATNGTDEKNTHPIIRVWLDKMCHLAGIQASDGERANERISDAFDWCLEGGNLPTWHKASAVYSRAYRLMEKHGSDDLLIEALNKGDEEMIKANMLRINEATVTAWRKGKGA